MSRLSLSTRRLAHVGGIGALLGGLMWVVKGGTIMLTGEQPPIVLEAGMFFFALGLVGLEARLEGRGGRLAKVGLLVAYVSAVSVLISSITGIFAPSLIPDEDSATILTPFIVLGGFGPFVGLVLMGVATLRVETTSTPWRVLPLAMGIGAIPLLIAGGVLALINERLFELPIVLLGLAWVVLGYSIWSGKGEMVRHTVRVN